MRAHIIDNGIVINTIEVESLDFLPNLIEGSEGGIGWTWDGETLAPPPAPPVPTPSSVTMRQARLALLAAGKLAGVDAAIDALPEPSRTQARIEWEYSQDVERSNPLLSLIAPALGLGDNDLDALFVQAAML